MGKVNSRFDDKGREKIQCRECANWYHILEVHLSKEHAPMNLKSYQAKHPGAPTRSEWGIQAAREGQARRMGTAPAPRPVAHAPVERPAPTPDPVDLIAPPSGPEPLRFGVASLLERTNDELTPYDRAFVPVHDEAWDPGPAETGALEELALAIQDNENVLIVGPPGVGKTTLVRELACLLNQPLRRCPFNGEMRLSSLIGSKDLHVDPATGQSITRWTNGPLPDAAEKGHWFLADELDSAPSQVTFVLHPVLEEQRHLMLMDAGGGTDIRFDPRFRFVATANTLGYGDDTGLYAGTAPMNEAFLDRFQTVIRVGYPTKEDELKIVMAKAPGIRRSWAENMVEIATKVREAQRNQETMVSVSPRRLIYWARKTVRFNDPGRAAKVSLLNKLPETDAKFIGGVVQRFFPSVTR